MARLLTAGFETGNVQELNGYNNGLAEVSTAEKRTGSYSLSVLGAAISGACGNCTHVFDTAVMEFYFRIAIRISASGVQGRPHIEFRNVSDAAELTLVLDTQSFKLYRGTESGGVLIASGTQVLRADTWYVLEGYALLAHSSGEFRTKINAVTDITYLGDCTIGAGDSAMKIVQFFGPVGATAGLLYLDDIAFNDTTGSFENSYPGLGGIFFQKATADGATTEFTPSAGSDHYVLVDDVPPNTTDWVQGENAGDLELFEIENTPTYVTQINVVQPVFTAALAVSGSNELRDVVLADSVEYPGSTTQTIVSIAPDYVLYRGETYYEQPDGVSGAFDATALDALQVGVEIPA